MSTVPKREVQLGERTVDFPSDYLQILEDSNHLLNDKEGLLKELADKGYLFLRGLHDRTEVLNARLSVLDYITKSGKDKIVEPVESGVLDSRCGMGCIPFMEGKNDITHSEEVLKVLEGHRPKDFFRKLFGEEPRTFDFKWLRGIHRKAFTGAHVDNVYMSRGTSNLYTMWTPIGDIPVEMGTLAICEGSNRIEGFKQFQDTYGQLDIEAVNLKGTGWFTLDPFEITKFGGQWKTVDFKAGDVLIFTLRTVHMSTSNLTDHVRISCDTRWQPASEPADERYIGDFQKASPKFGLYSDDTKEDTKQLTIEDFRQKWRL